MSTEEKSLDDAIVKSREAIEHLKNIKVEVDASRTLLAEILTLTREALEASDGQNDELMDLAEQIVTAYDIYQKKVQ